MSFVPRNLTYTNETWSIMITCILDPKYSVILAIMNALTIISMNRFKPMHCFNNTSINPTNLDMKIYFKFIPKTKALVYTINWILPALIATAAKAPSKSPLSSVMKLDGFT